MNLSFHFSRLQIFLFGIIAYLHLDLLAPSIVSAKVVALAIVDCVAIYFFLQDGMLGRKGRNVPQAPALTILAGNVIAVNGAIRVDELARAFQIPVYQLVRDLMTFDIFATSDTLLPIDVAEKVAARHGWKISRGEQLPEP
jgi:hypothetical protein